MPEIKVPEEAGHGLGGRGGKQHRRQMRFRRNHTKHAFTMRLAYCYVQPWKKQQSRALNLLNTQIFEVRRARLWYAALLVGAALVLEVVRVPHPRVTTRGN